MLHMPNIETFEPIRHKLRRDRDDPSDTKSSTDKVEPKRANDRNDMDEPNVP